MREIKNGWLIITRCGNKYIKLDNVLVGENRWLRYSDYTDIGHLKPIDLEESELFNLKGFDIVEIWAPKSKFHNLSFDLNDRNLTWKECEPHTSNEDVHKPKYIYIVDNNADPEFTTGTISVDRVFVDYEKAVDYIEKQGFEYLEDDIYKYADSCWRMEIKMYEVEE